MKGAVLELQNRVRALCTEEGANQTGIPAVTAYRCTGKTVPLPQSGSPYLYLVLDGTLRLYTPSGIMDYVAGQYSISKIDTPRSGRVLAQSERRDFLAAALELPICDIIAAVLELDDGLTEKIAEGGMEEAVMLRADGEVAVSVARLFAASGQQLLSKALQKNIVGEIIYYILCGSCGRQFLQSAAGIREPGEIYRANSWIKENFREPFSVEELARQRNMSVSLFHRKFKQAVGMGPLQCQKRLRLTEARRLMLDEDKNVTEAAAEVGYESLSQFIRDYRRIFGAAPKEDILILRRHLQE